MDRRRAAARNWRCSATNAFFFSTYAPGNGSYLYLLNLETTEVEEKIELPDDATHTSGLAYTGDYLIAADYDSGKLYFIDWYETLAAGHCVVKFAIPTKLQGTSACCFFCHDGREYLVVTDFKNSMLNYVLDYEQLIRKRDFEVATVATYQNGKASQGIAYHNGLLLDTNNTRLGFASIEIVCFDDIIHRKKICRKKVLSSLIGIEDLVVVGGRLYTSDEIRGVFCSWKVSGELHSA